ncbi:ABC transporter substrate-binding protein [Geobacter argillaceus]|uniref:Branched-chain amino acid transport system substrate-binding protein n=1 Tax=Geobacter argillaceus TaxID=345631 RepID=A0A562VIY9_9BACT|nr:ABC transporter substrate-binding protein [Geobacter argillaceus]TWJ17791.1 branched-chain amino acid transport system substrate-binding protein [Geobacter argillaceus]
MEKQRHNLLTIVHGVAVFLMVMCGIVALATDQAYAAGDTIKVGIITEMTGTFADFGRHIVGGAKAYMKVHGDTVAGKKVELIIRDTTGPVPDVAKRLAQELIVKDKVDFIAGLGFTPNALAIAPLVTEAKKPTIIMNAATSIITTKSPYFARVSMTLPQVTEPMAQWAFKKGYRKIYTLVADYGPGHDAEAAFKKAFTKMGGEVVGESRVPLKSPEFGPYVQRIKDAKPQAVFAFVMPGEMAVAFMKTYNERGLAKSGIKLLSTGDVMDDAVQDALGDHALGVISSHQYSVAHKSPENKNFLAAYSKFDPQRPNFMAVGGYDGMAAIYNVIKQLNGKIDGDKAMAVLKGMKLNSPRGPIQIDAATRDVVQNIYIREVKKVDGHYYNVEFETFNAVKDPGK